MNPSAQPIPFFIQPNDLNWLEDVFSTENKSVPF